VQSLKWLFRAVKQPVFHPATTMLMATADMRSERIAPRPNRSFFLAYFPGTAARRIIRPGWEMTYPPRSDAGSGFVLLRAVCDCMACGG
jgi:hypothetical protein